MRVQVLPTLMIRPLSGALADLMVCLRFFTRLPIPVFPLDRAVFGLNQSEDMNVIDSNTLEHDVVRKPVPTFRYHALGPTEWDPGAFGRPLRAAPLAGLVVGGIGALVLAFAIVFLALPHVLAAILALGAQVLVSGALHEDGLADVADGFGGGSNRERKLEIMRDSRIGTFGVLALIGATVLRLACVVILLDRYGAMTSAGVLPAVAAMSRGCCLLPLAILPPARRDGLAHAAGPLPPTSIAIAMGLAVFLGMTFAFLGGIGEVRAVAACGAALAASLAMTGAAHRQLGAQTGDVAGATQQVAEMAYLLTLLVAPSLG